MTENKSMTTLYEGFVWPVEDKVCVRCCKPNPCVLYQLCEDCHHKDQEELDAMRWLEELEDVRDHQDEVNFARYGY